MIKRKDKVAVTLVEETAPTTLTSTVTGRTYACTHCTRTFQSKYSVEKHMRVHDGL